MDHCDDVKAMWQDYLATLPPGEEPPTIYMTWHFGNACETADALGRLAVAGTKTATSSLLWDYEAEEEELPRPGDVSIVTDWDGAPLCIIETTAVEVKPFNEVGAEHACAEGEGDRSLAYWRQVHWEAFTASCATLGRMPKETMPVVCERFRVIYPNGGIR
jgi:uncharacterized protein YhfF